MKIRETIQGATANTVVYEDGKGDVQVISRPPFISVDEIIKEIETNEKKDNVKKVETQVKEDKQPTPEETTVNPSKFVSNEPKTGGGVNTQKNSTRN